MEAQTKNCQNCKKDFIIESEDFNFYEKIKVPPPTFCPECRNVQRLASRNVKSLYKRACDLCGEEVISRFSKNNKAKMYCHECWWGDKWDAFSYAKEYDFSNTFHLQFNELLFSVPHMSLQNINMVGSDYCNMESDDKRCYLTFGGHYNEDCAFSEYSFYNKEIFDSFWTFKSEQCSNCIMVENCYRTFYSTECNDCMDTYFSFDCRNCSDIVGCAGLRNKKYCILNKQHTKEEYENLVSKIIKHMNENPLVSKINGNVYKYGDFFPAEHALFAYNETVANDFYPKRKEEAEKEGFIWREEPEVSYTFSDYKIPDNIIDVKDDVLEKVLKCEITGKAYRITKQELIFYRKLNIPIPRIAPLSRIKFRIQSLPPFKFFDRNCMKCGIEIETSYSPERPEIIYCEKCYQKEVY